MIRSVIDKEAEKIWLGLQADYELEQAHRALGDLPARIKRLAA